MQYKMGSFTGIIITEPEPDWRGYRKLYFEVTSASKSNINLTLEVYDKAHNFEFNDRFNVKSLIRPGLNVIQISLDNIQHGPVDRELDLENVSGVALFARKEEWKRIEVGSIFLK